MPKRAVELSAVAVRRIAKPGLHAVGGVAGLLLQVTKAGARSWILRATVGSKRRDIGLGAFPDVTLAQARHHARETRDKIRQGVDPIAEREAVRQALIASQRARLTFAEAARRKHAAIAGEFRNAKHAKQWLSTLERYAVPIIGDMDVSTIELPHVLGVLEPIWQSKTETASRVRQRMEAVFSWAIVSGHRTGTNPAEWKGNLSEVLAAPAKIAKATHHRALPWPGMPGFMADLRQRKGTAARALEFAILTAARSGEVRLAAWDEFDIEAGIWTVPADRIKAGKQHRVPLSPEALAIIRAMPKGSQYVFAGQRGGALSDMALSSVTKRMGVEAVPHGFRSSFKDWARNKTSAADEVSELALAHVNSDATRAAYARDELLPARARMMKQWATYCAKPAVQSATVTDIGVRA